jgi:predicted dehydrogenase
MTMMGGVRLVAQTNQTASSENPPVIPTKVAVIGLGVWGREIINTLALLPEAQIAALCDTYPAALKRCSSLASSAAQTRDYREILGNAEIPAVIVATPTHQHKEIVLAAIKAGKHVYCETPLAHTVDDAKEIALAKAAPELTFQTGLHMRMDRNRKELIKTFRSGALGQLIMARTQSHKKTSWRMTSPNPDREKELNWRLSRLTSTGLIGEIGTQLIDQSTWFLNQQPLAVSGLSSNAVWRDGRDVPDTVRAMIEFPESVSMTVDITLGNSFDKECEMYYGSYAALMLRQSDIWLFQETDSPLQGWEVYFPKETFFKQTGFVLKVGGSKSVATAEPSPAEVIAESPLGQALSTFLRNAGDLVAARERFIQLFGDDPEPLSHHLVKEVLRRSAPGWREAYNAAVTTVKTNEAILTGHRILLQPEWFQLG